MQLPWIAACVGPCLPWTCVRFAWCVPCVDFLWFFGRRVVFIGVGRRARALFVAKIYNWSGRAGPVRSGRAGSGRAGLSGRAGWSGRFGPGLAVVT